MSDDLIDALGSIGAHRASLIIPESSYALIGRKGAPPGSVPEMFSTYGPVTLFSNFMKQTKPIKPFIEVDALSLSSYPGGYSEFMINKQIVNGPFSSGLNVMTIDPFNGTVLDFKNYDTTIDANNSDKFVADIIALPTGTVVALSTVGPAGLHLNNGVDTIIDYLGGKLIKTYSAQSYCIISTTGKQLTGEQRSLFTGSGFSFCVTSMAQSSTSTRIMVNGQSMLMSLSGGLNVVTVDQQTGNPNITFTWPYEAISRHYKWALGQVFRMGFKAAIVLEDDLEISPDFYDYFDKFYPMLKKDKSLFCVSAWNDNSKRDFIPDFDQASIEFKRTDFFPGLGWMLTSSFWDEIRYDWPTIFWDEYPRKKSVVKDRQCIQPVLPRVRNIGNLGSSGTEIYTDWLSKIEKNNRTIDYKSIDISYLELDTYRKYMEKQVQDAQDIQLYEIDTFGYRNKTLKIQYGNRYDFTSYAKQLGIMDDMREEVARTSFDGIVALHYKDNLLYLVKRNNYQIFDASMDDPYNNSTTSTDNNNKD
eukprot:gene3515-4016_t